MTARLDPPACNGTPPRHFEDPYVLRWYVTLKDLEGQRKGEKARVHGFRATWEQAIREYVPLDPTIGYIAMLVATHTDYDTGRNAWPGEERLVRYTGRCIRTVRNSLAWLDEHGILTRESEGRRAPQRNYADVYLLSLPAPLLVLMGRLGEDSTLWVERGNLRDKPPERVRLSQANYRQLVTGNRQPVTNHRQPAA